ncbi:unnamed protein product [Clonostachys rhizophaga]|uniref:Carboxymuconolactone decarboxylase-like domain-containing protein n=1 Tax=Clonostachys rhizophaga TaxID=160324 RepID=A0A9N9UZ71_9HYPO|nr:unnamed protein product [Clonostachys rhizophaga]
MSSTIYDSADFHGKFTAANVTSDSTQYDHAYILLLQVKLSEAGSESGIPGNSISLIVRLVSLVSTQGQGINLTAQCAIFCGLKRPDLISAYFHELTQGETDESKLKIYFHMRESMNVVWPFVGLPNVISACYGLFDELRKLGLEPPAEVKRPGLGEMDWVKIGDQNRRAIYKGSNNIDGIAMLEKYFPTLSGAVVQGYLQYGAGEPDSLPQTELLVAAAITASGVRRQSRTHCQSALGLGCTVEKVQAVVDVAAALANWNKTPLGSDFDINALSAETAANVEKRKT